MSYSSKIKELFKNYGRVGVAVHLTIYASTLAGEHWQALLEIRFTLIGLDNVL